MMLRFLIILATMCIAVSHGHAQFSAPPDTDTTYSFHVLPHTDASTANPRQIIEAAQASTRNSTQQMLWLALGQPYKAEMLQTRIPNDADIAFRNSVQNNAAKDHARWADYVMLTYQFAPSTPRIAQITSAGATLLAHPEIQSAHQVQESQFSALPAEQGGYLGAGAQPYDTANIQWGMHVMRFPQAWEKIRGNAYVGVVDNGIDVGHPDLMANVRPQLSRATAFRMHTF